MSIGTSWNPSLCPVLFSNRFSVYLVTNTTSVQRLGLKQIAAVDLNPCLTPVQSYVSSYEVTLPTHAINGFPLCETTTTYIVFHG